jgi:TolB protein
MPKLRIAVLLTFTTLVAALVVAAAAQATAPGTNGKIVFRRWLNADQSWGAVFTINADGSGARQITHPARGVLDDAPTWSPDGTQITFMRCPGKVGLCHMFVVAPDGSGLTPVGPLCPSGADPQTCPDDGGASFSPDSTQLAFVQSTGLVKQVPITGDQIEHSAVAVMNRHGSGRRVIYQGAPFSADINYPVFSPDGKQLVFEQHNSGLSQPANKNAVFVIGVDGSHLRRLTPWSENDGDNPDWSPDGNWIIYHSHLDDPSAQAQYYLIHPDGTGRRQITHFPNGTHLASAAFAPDGRSIVLAKGPEGGNIDVFTMRLDGSHLQRLTRSKLWDSAPEWGPSRTT